NSPMPTTLLQYEPSSVYIKIHQSCLFLSSGLEEGSGGCHITAKISLGLPGSAHISAMPSSASFERVRVQVLPPLTDLKTPCSGGSDETLVTARTRTPTITISGLRGSTTIELM